MADGTERRATGLRLALRVWRAEGSAAMCDRWLDRLEAGRRRRKFRPLGTGEAPRVPVLNVLHTPPRPDFGGVQVQLLHRLEAENRPWALLYPETGGWRLEIAAGEILRWVCFETFEKGILAAIDLLGARIVHLEHILGMPLESLAQLPDQGLRLVLSLHDYAFFCPRPHLLEKPFERFCHFSRDPERCLRCLRHDWSVEKGFQEKRRQITAELMHRADALIFPSENLRDTFRELVPGRDSEKAHVIAPVSLLHPPRLPPRAPGPVQHVAYVGSVHPHKGAVVFEEVVHAMRSQSLRWSVYGGGDPDLLTRLRRLPGVRIRGYYRNAALPELLRRDGVDLALLLSTWPETYGMTLDECWHAGAPAIVFDHGAMAERVRQLGGGAVVNPEAGAEGVIERLREALEGSLAVPPGLTEWLPRIERAAAEMRRVYAGLEAG